MKTVVFLLITLFSAAHTESDCKVEPEDGDAEHCYGEPCDTAKGPFRDIANLEYVLKQEFC